MRRHLASASYLFAADVIVRGLNFVVVAWLARTLEPALYGTIIIGASVLDYALLLSDWGLKTLGTRETATPRDLRRFQPHQITAARVALTLAIFAIAQIAVALLPLDERQSTIIRIYLLGLLPYALLLDWYHQGLGHFGAITLARALGSLLLAGGALALVRGPGDWARVPWLYLASMAATTISLLVATRGVASRLVPERVMPARFASRELASVMRSSASLGVAALFGQSFVVLPPIVAGQFLGPTEAGVLYAAMRIIVLALVIDRIFGSIYLPALSRVWQQEDRDRVRERLESVFRVVVALGVGASTLLVVFAQDLIAMVYGRQYSDAVEVLMILSPFVAATLVNTFFAYGLIAIGEERQYLRSGVTSGLIFIVMVIFATPLVGLRATAVAMTLGELVMSGLLFVAFRRHVGIRAIRPVVVSVAIGTLLIVASTALDARSLWLAPAYVVVFLGGLYLLGGVHVSDLRAQPR